MDELSSQTYLNTYRVQKRSSLLAEGLGTRANSIWKMANYIVAFCDDSQNEIPFANYLKGWSELCKIYKDQFLIIELASKGDWQMYDAKGHFMGGNDYIEQYIKEHTKKAFSLTIPLSEPLQQIFYGAPGTGKSHTINRETKGRKTFRTTFHPDSDYSTFVGAYKPVMEEVETRVVPVVLHNGAVFDQNCGTLREKKISYKFVKQAFMKAYIAAWREFADVSLAHPIQTTGGVTLFNKSRNDSWTLNEVKRDSVNYTKESKIDVGRYEALVKNYWEAWTNADDPETFSPGRSDNYLATACVWYKKNHDPHVETSAEDCWTAVEEYLGQGKSIEENPKDRLYRVTIDEGVIKIYSNTNAYRVSIKKPYDELKHGEKVTGDSVQKNIAMYLMNDTYSSMTFDEAWEKLKEEVNSGQLILAPTQTESVNTVSPVFLIIEEINRGNCAQIFGDLFQLLDRKEGFSQYPIHADEDVRKCLVSNHSDEDPSFGINGLDFSPEQASYINSVLDCEDNVAEKIARGEVLVLPPNLYIWATMNTSDQSLFPIDSAFKRRWEWKYVPITQGRDKDTGRLLQWHIVANNVKYDWWSFLEVMNKRVGDITSSEDKKLGFFFCKADGQGVISADKFVSKVMFYLWNDVFKDYPDNPIAMHLKEEGGEFTFGDFYTTNAGGDVVVREELVTLLFKALGVEEG